MSNPRAFAPVVGRKQFRLIWLAVFLVSLVPFARLFWLGYHDDLTANPIEFVTRSTGTWTLVFLCITLAVTPARKLTGLGWLLRLRRMLGLYAFFYACIHLMTYVWFDQWFDLSEMIKDVFKRPFVTAGFAAYLLMVPLALSSNGFAMRRLGRGWQLLHRLIYLIAPIALLHFWWHKSGKNDFIEPIIYTLLVAALLGVRLIWRQRAVRVRAAARPGD